MDADAVADAAAASAAARRIWGSLGLGLVFLGGSLIVSKPKAAQKFNRLFRGHGMMPWEMGNACGGSPSGTCSPQKKLN